MAPKKPQFYLAGKVNGVKWDVVKGFTDAVFVASDYCKHSEHGWGYGSAGLEGLGGESGSFEDMVLVPLDRSIAVLAVLDTTDSYGSLVEIALASSMGKPVHMILLVPEEAHLEKEKWCHSSDCQQCVREGTFCDAYWFAACLPRVTSSRAVSLKDARSQAGKFVAKFTYKEYLASPEWQKKRKAKLAASGNKCQLCASSKDLNVHHNTYTRVRKELPEDLVVLCRECHEKFHDKV